MVELKILVVVLCHTIMLLWLIELKIDWNQLLPTIESRNLVAIMIFSNSDFELPVAADAVAIL